MSGTYSFGAETKPVRFGLQEIAAVSLLRCERDPSLVDQVTFLFYMLSRSQSLLHGWSRNSISFSGCLIPVAQWHSVCCRVSLVQKGIPESQQGSADYQQMPVLKGSRARNKISWSCSCVPRRLVYEPVALSECFLIK
jgi:hypothetical protein